MVERGTEPHEAGPAGASRPGPVPQALVDERWRMLRSGMAADRRNRGARFRRRALIPAAVASGVIAGTSFLSGWAESTTPASTVAAPSISAATDPTSAELAALAQLQRTLNADRAAIAALPTALPAAGSPAPAPGGTTGAPSAAPAPAPAPAGTAAPSAPSVPALPALPSISVAPPASPPPAVQGTTGASGLP